MTYEGRPTTRARRQRRARTAISNDAAAALRKELRANARELEYVACAMCPGHFPLSGVDVDHVIPLSAGGRDVASNLQVLCKACHADKTRGDMGYGAPRI